MHQGWILGWQLHPVGQPHTTVSWSQPPRVMHWSHSYQKSCLKICKHLKGWGYLAPRNHRQSPQHLLFYQENNFSSCSRSMEGSSSGEVNLHFMTMEKQEKCGWKQAWLSWCWELALLSILHCATLKPQCHVSSGLFRAQQSSCWEVGTSFFPI